VKLSEILCERYINLITPQQRHPYAQKVWDMINDTYEKHAGGVGHASPEDLMVAPGVWKLATRNGQVKGGAVYRDHNGRKLRLVFHDGTTAGKAEMKRIMMDDIMHGRAWGEFSGPLEKVMLRMGGKPLPNHLASKVLGKPVDKLDDDGYHYWRTIDGAQKREIIIGNPMV
jgi:hypothetical protein